MKEWAYKTGDLLTEVQFIGNLYDGTRKRWPFNTGDCLIEVTAWASLTVYIYIVDVYCNYWVYTCTIEPLCWQWQSNSNPFQMWRAKMVQKYVEKSLPIHKMDYTNPSLDLNLPESFESSGHLTTTVFITINK